MGEFLIAQKWVFNNPKRRSFLKLLYGSLKILPLVKSLVKSNNNVLQKDVTIGNEEAQLTCTEDSSTFWRVASCAVLLLVSHRKNLPVTSPLYHEHVIPVGGNKEKNKDFFFFYCVISFFIHILISFFYIHMYKYRKLKCKIVNCV
jgi:hypothetical protein